MPPRRRTDDPITICTRQTFQAGVYKLLSYPLHKALKTNVAFNDLLTWKSTGNMFMYSSRTIYLISLKLLGQGVLGLSFAKGVRDQHDFSPTDPNTHSNTGHLNHQELVYMYLTSKFEASGAKRSWAICCIRLRETVIPTDKCKAICPSFEREGGGDKYKT